MVNRRAIAFGFALLAACSTSKGADDRFLEGLEPAKVQDAEGLLVEAWPATARLVDGGAVIRAASPELRLTLVTEVRRRARVTVENLPRTAVADPAPQDARWTGPTTLEASWDLLPGRHQVRFVRGGAGPLRLGVISDLHSNEEVFQAIARDVRERRPELVLCMGDFVASGAASEFDRVFERLGLLEAPVYATIGNHELYGEAADRYAALIGPANVGFRWGAEVLLIDSASASAAPLAYPWIEERLSARSAGTPAIALMHIPPLDPAGMRDHAFRMRDEGLRMAELLSAHSVDHLFAGHIHTYQPFELRGVPATLSGGGGGVREKLNGVRFHWLEVVADPGASPRLRVERRDVL